MKKQELLDLGVDEETVKKIMAIHGKDIQAEQAKTASAEQERDGLNDQIAERDKQLKDLKENVGDNDDLKQQIKSLEDTNKQVKDDYQAKLDQQAKDFKVENALVGAGAKNTKAVKALLDLDKVTVDGDNLKGLDDQLENVKAGNDYLFKQEDTNNHDGPTVTITKKGNPAGGGDGKFDISKASYKDILQFKQDHPKEYEEATKE
ncbi:phage scaffolding protein [Ligilactobacillus pobuzihii]|uniref:Scaffolding protein n=1 Tax=Ligilactobacillus pobuzihii TaxID=449659 RepID=A0A0R2LDG2_9LACO|nr:phage scaffolding protein [Ligilactobacillus pobuzihii]KRK10960.1 hypothetical protein FD11_GL001230 [Ligilactobacillus pobuzihii E100301 = KCTC 13174]KRN99505.1 hypothetical protein IV66_GL001509 [Ligilactobacillus pobuzihii]GEN48947.1 hypothetical protein LPO01_17390 [Ligilactobacillus pobuzihii]